MNDCIILWIIELIIWVPLLLKWVFPKAHKCIRPLRPYYTWIRNRFTLASGSTVLLVLHAILVIVIGCCTLEQKELSEELCKLEGNGWDRFIEFLESRLSVLGDRLSYGIGCFLKMLQGDFDHFLAGASDIKCYAIFLCIAVPTFTASAVIMSVLHFLPQFICFQRETMVFSGVNERSLLLAESMDPRSRQQKEQKGTKTNSSRKQRTKSKDNQGYNERLFLKKRRFIFLYTDRDKLSPDELMRLKSIKARIYPYSAQDLLSIHRRLRKSQLRFFFLTENSTESFDKLKQLIDAIKVHHLFKSPWTKKTIIQQREKLGIYHQEFYILSESDTSPLLADHLRREMSNNGVRLPVFAHTDLRLLDRYRIVTYKLLQEHPLYKPNFNDEKSSDKIRILILGFGRVGQSFFRSTAAFSAMRNKDVSCTIFDSKVDEHWNELLAQAPEIEQVMPVTRETVNLESKEFTDKLDKYTKATEDPFTYIVLSIGEDDRNIRVARNLVRYYRRMHWIRKSANSTLVYPAIFINLENCVKAQYINDIFKINEKDPLARLSPTAIGGDQDTFAEETLLNRKLWNAAIQLHRSFEEDQSSPDTEQTLTPFLTEYDRRSSIATVSFAKYHKLVSNMEDNINAEHSRWSAYSRSEGMQQITPEVAIKIIKSPLETHKDVIASLTPCLTSINDLMKHYDDIKSQYPEDKLPRKSFKEKDEHVVKRIPYLRTYYNKNIEEFNLSDWQSAWNREIKKATRK